MSHELRTPLNAVIGFSEVLLDGMFGELNDKQREYLNDIRDSGRHLLELLNEILDLSKIEAGRMELEPGPFSLVEALERGMAMVRDRAAQHSIELALEVEPGVDVIVADQLRIKQVILNLITNAVKFTPDGGRVEVRAREVEGRLEVTVRDTGIGIAPGGSGEDLRVLPDRRPGREGRGGHRPRPDAVPQDRRVARRSNLGRERGRTGEHVRVHPAASPARG